MPRRTTFALLATALAAATGLTPATATPPRHNWVVYELTAREPATGFDHVFSVPVRYPRPSDVTTAFAIGTSVGSAGDTRERHWFPLNWGVERIDLTGPVEASYRLDDGPSRPPYDAYEQRGGVGILLEAGQSIALAFAVPTGYFTGPPTLSIDSPAFDVELVARGSGAGVVDIRSPGADGVTAGVNHFGPARATTTVRTRGGALFTIPVTNCYDGECTWTVRSPAGSGSTSGTFAQSPVLNSGGSSRGRTVWSGPAGEWSWSLDAPVYAGRAVAAYIPVGAHWTKFR